MSKSKSTLDMVRVVEKIARELGSTVPLQRAWMFLLVAQAGDAGTDLQALSRQTGLAESTATRNIQALGKFDRFKKPGLDLVEARVDPADFRRRSVFLTAKGKAMAKRLGM